MHVVERSASLWPVLSGSRKLLRSSASFVSKKLRSFPEKLSVSLLSVSSISNSPANRFAGKNEYNCFQPDSTVKEAVGSTTRGRMSMADRPRSIMWFRKGLRLHDNPALHAACADGADHVFPIFILDPFFLKPDPNAPSPGSATVGINRIRFLLESLQDLDKSLQQRDSRLLLIHGNPTDVLPQLIDKWRIGKLCFERDTEPYAIDRDSAVKEMALGKGVKVVSPTSHTLFDPDKTIAKAGGSAPISYQQFLRAAGTTPPPSVGDPPPKIPPPPQDFNGVCVVPVPSLEELGYQESQEHSTPFKGGETEGLRRLDEHMARKEWVLKFEKPKGDPTAFLDPATTVLSPYLKFGCVSSRLFYERLKEITSSAKNYTKPPVSLDGQLLWREFFYTAGYGTPNFDRMVGNRICKQIPWQRDEELLAAWRDARTGYPWIDAAMVQLRQWGWMHHLARHAVACFLTRGDLYVHWELGRDVFDRLLIDADWSINNGNWMWLSASCFFYQYHRIYSPTTFGKKYDPDGKYVRHFLPVLKDMPKAYIYEPWTAPLEVQRKANCIIGKDYPQPIVQHAEASKACRERMAAAYALNKGGQPSEEEVAELAEGAPEAPGHHTTNPSHAPKELRVAHGKGKRPSNSAKSGKPEKQQKLLDQFVKRSGK